MSASDESTAILHMRDASRKVIRFSSNRSRVDLESDELLALGLVRLLEIIGEAATRVGVATRTRNPAIPWVQVVGMRNRLIHGYDVVDLDVLWQTVTDDIPQLVRDLENVAMPS